MSGARTTAAAAGASPQNKPLQMPLVPGAARAFDSRGQFHKSHTLGRSDVVVDPRAIVPPNSFSGTGAPRHVEARAPIAAARGVSASSVATSWSSTGRLDGTGRVEVEQSFADSAHRDAQDRLAHLRRAPVARDYDSTAEPRGHLPVLGPSRLPAFVEFDRKVLRFSGYCREAAHQVALGSEPFRIRPIVLLYHLEDDTMQISEPPTANSGLAQGVVVRRQRVPFNEQGGCFTLDHLFVGAELPVYGRMYRLTGADAFTRAFYEQNGAPLEEDEQQPLDPFARKSAVAAPRSFRKTANADSIHAEAERGNPPHRGIEATQKFLRNDGKVLRFYAQWEDTKLYGEIKPYIVHYFLADDTVEVCEVSQPNSGYGSFPALLKRSRLPRDHTLIKRDVAHVGGTAVAEEDARLQYVSEADLRVGGILPVYGRELLLCGCDEFTRRYYKKHYGLTDDDFALAGKLMADPQGPPVPTVAVPPPTGFGSDEDSLGSYLHLVPREPKTDQKKLHEMDGVLLRFLAKFGNPAPVDKGRRFILTYYLANDTLQIFEEMERNTGHIGGKWLDRQRVKNARSANGQEFFGPADLFVGGTITVNKTDFILLEADEYTKKFIQANPNIWNEARGNLPRTDVALAFTGGLPIMSKASRTHANTGGRPF